MYTSQPIRQNINIAPHGLPVQERSDSDPFGGLDQDIVIYILAANNMLKTGEQCLMKF